MGSVQRRGFLRLAAIGCGLPLLVSCAAPPPPTPTAAPAKGAEKPTAAPASPAPQPTAAPAKPAAPTAAPPKPAVTLKLASIAGGIRLLNYEFARQKGFLAAQGVTPEITGVQTDILLVQGVQAGEFEIANGGASAPFSAISKGAPFKVIANCWPTVAHAFYAQPSIKSVEELRGKSLGIAAIGGFAHVASVLWLRAKGIDPSQVEFAAIGTANDVFKGILSGKVAGGIAGVELLGLAKRQGIAVLTDAVRVDIPDFITDAFYARAVDIADPTKRETLIRFLTAVAQANRALYDPKEKDAYVKLVVDVQKLEPADAAFFYDWSIKNRLFSANLEMTPVQAKIVQDVNVEFGQQTQVVPYEQVADMSLQQEVVKRIGPFKYPG